MLIIHPQQIIMNNHTHNNTGNKTMDTKNITEIEPQEKTCPECFSAGLNPKATRCKHCTAILPRGWSGLFC